MSKFRISQKSDQNTSWVFWIVMCFVSMTLIIAPFYQGLFNGSQFFFERPIFIFTTWTAVALIAISIYMFKHWKLNSQTDLMAVAVWLIPLTYLISMLNAASYYSAIQELYLHIVYVVFFLIGFYFSRSVLGAAILRYGLIGSGYVIVIHGLLNWFGNVHYYQAVMGKQLSGVFQYPNTYAAFLTGILVATLILISKSNKWYMIIPHAFMLVPIMVSILLTLSRGGLVIMPVVILIYLMFLPRMKQLFVLIYLALIGVEALAVYNKFISIRTELMQQFVGSASLKGWTILVILSLLTAVAIYFIQRFVVQPLTIKYSTDKVFKLANFMIPALFAISVVAGGFLLFGNNAITDIFPEGLKQRIQSLSLADSSVAARAEFYEDAIKIIKDYPVFGAGGGGWAGLYSQYKSYPYTSQQTHNVVIQVLVDTGILGFLIFMSIIVACYFLYIRYVNNQKAADWDERTLVWPLFGFTILLHSVIDFDMSFVYLSALVFLCLGVTGSVTSSKASREIPTKYTRALKVFPALLAIAAIWLLVSSIQATKANSLYTQARTAVSTGDYNEISKSLDKAIKLQPNHTEYTVFKTSLLIQLYEQTKQEQFSDEATDLLKRLRRNDPSNSQVTDMQISLFLAKGEHEQALNLLENNMKKYPWDMHLFERAIDINFDLGDQARTIGNKAEMNRYWNDALAYYERAKEKVSNFETFPEKLKSGNAFSITRPIALAIGQVYFIQGQYDQAKTVLEHAVSRNFDDYTNRLVTRWYFAAIQKCNIANQELYDSFVSKFPEEVQQIEAIVENF